MREFRPLTELARVRRYKADHDGRGSRGSYARKCHLQGLLAQVTAQQLTLARNLYHLADQLTQLRNTVVSLFSQKEDKGKRTMYDKRQLPGITGEKKEVQ